jgi:hypothetical protein
MFHNLLECSSHLVGRSSLSVLKCMSSECLTGSLALCNILGRCRSRLVSTTASPSALGITVFSIPFLLATHGSGGMNFTYTGNRYDDRNRCLHIFAHLKKDHDAEVVYDPSDPVINEEDPELVSLSGSTVVRFTSLARSKLLWRRLPLGLSLLR